MQEAAPGTAESTGISFRQFLSALIQSLDDAGIRFCALRNYEGFSEGRAGRDVDLLIQRSQLPSALSALSVIKGIRIVGYAERFYVATVLFGGISVGSNIRALQVDFYLCLTWKGLPYLDTNHVLQSAVPRGAGNQTFLVPSKVHESIISLFAGLLLAGVLKEKYFEPAQRTFASDRSGAVAALSPHFGLKASIPLVDAVIEGNRGKVLACVTPLRASLALRSLRNPARNALNFVRHYAREFAARLTPRDLETVCIVGARACDQSTIDERLMPILQCTSVEVEKRYSGPRFTRDNQSPGILLREDASGNKRSNWLVSSVKIVRWLLEEWQSQFFGKSVPTLRICESSYYELLADPDCSSWSGPKWLLRLAGRLLPAADLWILLEPPTDGLQSIGLNHPITRATEKAVAYRSFAKTRKKYVILDAGKTPAKITEEAYAAIIDKLAERADKQIKSRFK